MPGDSGHDGGDVGMTGHTEGILLLVSCLMVVQYDGKDNHVGSTGGKTVMVWTF